MPTLLDAIASLFSNPPPPQDVTGDIIPPKNPRVDQYYNADEYMANPGGASVRLASATTPSAPVPATPIGSYPPLAGLTSPTRAASPDGTSLPVAMRDAVVGRSTTPGPVAARDAVRQYMPSTPPPMSPPVRGNTFRDALADIAAGMSTDVTGLSKGGAFARGFAGSIGAAGKREQEARKQQQDYEDKLFSRWGAQRSDARAEAANRRAEEEAPFSRGLRERQEGRAETSAKWANAKNMMEVIKARNPQLTFDQRTKLTDAINHRYRNLVERNKTTRPGEEIDIDKEMGDYLGTLERQYGIKLRDTPAPAIPAPAAPPAAASPNTPPPASPSDAPPAPAAPVARGAASGTMQLQNLALPSTAQPSGPNSPDNPDPPPQTQEAYDQMKPGTYYRHPDGSIRKKGGED